MFELNKKNRTDTNADVFSNEGHRNDGVVALTDDLSPTAETVRRDVAVIGRSIRINGDLYGDEDVRIEGDVTGTIKLTKNTLTIGREGKVHANVYAKTVTVDGVMEGDLYGSERVSIRKNAQVRGNITAPRVSVEDGARFKGSIEMDPKVAAAALVEGDVAESPAAMDEPTMITAKPARVATTSSNGDKLVAKPETALGKVTEKHEPMTG